MDKEVSMTIKFGITLALLAAAIGVGFGIFVIVRSSLLAGSTNIDSRDTKNEIIEIDKYDYKQVSGTEVIDALYKYSKDDFSVLISTLEWNKNASQDCKSIYGANNPVSDKTKNNGIYGAYTKLGNMPIRTYLPRGGTYEAYSAGTNFNISSPENNTLISFINYKTILGNESKLGPTVNFSQTYGGREVYTSLLFYKESTGRFICPTRTYTMERNMVLQNNTYQNLNNPGSAEYINPNSRFKSYIIEDEMGDPLGIAFYELEYSSVTATGSSVNDNKVSFTIDGITYYAGENQSVFSWVNGSDNTAGFKLQTVAGRSVLVSSSGGIVKLGNRTMNSMSIIGIAGNEYRIESPSEPTIVTFKINGNNYSGEDGQTLEDWVLSEYNTYGFSIKDQKVTLGTKVVEQNKTEIITQGSSFTFVAEKIKFRIAGTEYTADKGMTWLQWVDSGYNTDGFYRTGRNLYNKDGREVAVNNIGATKITENANYLLR